MSMMKFLACEAKRKELPQALDDLIARATAKDPDERPRTAGEFLEELQKISN
jgi:serine/threonine-protein kinase